MMTTVTADLAEFLTVRIEEDRAAAAVAASRNGEQWTGSSLMNGSRIEGTAEHDANPRAQNGDRELWDDEGALGMHDETAAHIVRWDPARVLAECDAKRRIVQQARPVTRDSTGVYPRDVTYVYDVGVPWVLKLLALPYADHPDYRDEWRP
jgi:hypothetical protein